MKKSLFLLCFVLLTLLAKATPTSKEVNLSLPGTLSTTLSSAEKIEITELKITGNIDARDFRCMRDEMTVLAIVDLSLANVLAYIGSDATVNTLTTYPANEMPTNSFCNNDFNGKSSLQSVKLPNSLTSIGNTVLSQCWNLTGTMVIPNSVTTIGEKAFADCGITGLILGNSLITIQERAFALCGKITGVLIIPNSVTSIGANAFANCNGLSGVSIGTSVITINEGAFNSCGFTDLNLIIPNSVTTIGNSAFESCSGITGLTIGNSVTTIGDYNFQGSKIAGVLNIPNSVKTIGSNTFQSCSLLTGVTFGNSLTSLGYSAFYSCTGLTGTLVLPNSLITIDEFAFGDCGGISGKLIIPNSVTTIGFDAFGEATGLTELTIGSSVTSIANKAFEKCSGLTKISINQSTPPTIFINTFANVNKTTCTLEVPTSKTNAYKAADFWKEFLTINGKDFNTSTINAVSNQPKIYGSDAAIIIEGTSKNEIITVYSIHGQQIRTIKSAGTSISVPLKSGATYLIKTNSKTHKVIL